MFSEGNGFQIQFVGVGPKRTGTTWVHEVFEQHPEICLPLKIKETMFFDLYHDKGIDWYRSHFTHSGARPLHGEVGPSYFNSGLALERLYNHNPNCKVIINIRNPIEHAFSLYQHELSNGLVDRPFFDAIESDNNVLGSGHYARYIPLWQKKFGEDNVTFVWMDQIKTEPNNTYERLCAFLDVSDQHYSAEIADRKVNSAKRARSALLSRIGLTAYYWLREYRLHSLLDLAKYAGLNKLFYSSNGVDAPSFTDGEKERLINLYGADISYLEAETGRDLSKWRKIV